MEETGRASRVGELTFVYCRSVLRITNPSRRSRLQKSKLFPKLSLNPALSQTFTGDRKIDISSGSVGLEVIEKGNHFIVAEIVPLKLKKSHCFFSLLWRGIRAHTLGMDKNAFGNSRIEVIK